MNYYLLRQDVLVPEKWVLGDVRHVNNWNFIDPPVNFMEPGAYALDVRFDGCEVDYSLAGYASVPVLSLKAYKALSGLPEVDEPYCNVVFEPVRFENKKVREEYFLMIIETQFDCVDEKKSGYKKFETDDPVRPDLAGEYHAFTNLVIDPEKVGHQHIFRVKKYLGAIIVSEEVKRRVEMAGVGGVLFESVNGDRNTVA
ncbi:imm11 family protein [Pseudomonas sp. Au-Pse12]|uniref:imm11 family protein n=1 Tax=Pseudomonas sp. Au-Pse12 TaxID=2906459 RepID=UPI001E572CE7|nr:DUF1629 domain-containing protein [Pseudomonas sp. Au-Pse12]MCE4056167.1 hypothetical protein [Pseudomonas sp. Au-Pse12]